MKANNLWRSLALAALLGGTGNLMLGLSTAGAAQIPNGSSHSFNGVSCVSAEACAAVGEWDERGYSIYSGYPALGEVWNGKRWKIHAMRKQVASEYEPLSAVSCSSADMCMAVGRTGVPGIAPRSLTEEWNGRKWTFEKTPFPQDAYGDPFLYGVSCTSVCVAVGDYLATAGGTPTLIERWNGLKWKLQKAPYMKDVANSLNGVSCTSASFCVAVGHHYNSGATIETGVIDSWNGSHWTSRSAPSPSGATSTDLASVSCVRPTWCTAVGHAGNGTTSGPIVEHWNGTKWTILSISYPAGSTPDLRGVSCTSTTSCMAVGLYWPNGTFEGYQTFAQRWNGKTWSMQATLNPATSAGVSPELLGVSCWSPIGCTAVGEYLAALNNETVEASLAEVWNGDTWRIQPTPTNYQDVVGP